MLHFVDKNNGGKLSSAEIITIGTELLLGEIQDTNTRQIALFLRNEGIDLFRATMVGDNEKRIISAVQEAITRSNLVITTGGLGPTVDDPTRQAIASALGTELVFRTDLWDQIKQRFEKFGRTPTENNKKQAYIPKEAIAIENAVGTAPAFFYETVNGIIISLPGVPRELEYLLENQVKQILKKYLNDQAVIHALVVHTAGLGESVVDEKIADLEELSNPTVGMVAYPGQTDIRITAKAKNLEEANEMIAKVNKIVHQRLGDCIFGYDADSLGMVVAKLLHKTNNKLILCENGTNDQIKNMLSPYNVLVDNSSNTVENISDITQNCFEGENENQEINQIILMADLIKTLENQAVLKLRLIKQEYCDEKTFMFGGHVNLSYLWAVNTALNYLRNFLLTV